MREEPAAAEPGPGSVGPVDRMIDARASLVPAGAASGSATPVPGRCPVCAETLSGARVARCARCETSHHLDCIEYAGSCAIYGCGSRSYRTVRGWRRLRGALVPSSFPGGMPPGREDDRGLRNLVEPVLRIDARRVQRSRRIAAGLAAAAGGVLAGTAVVWIGPIIALALVGPNLPAAHVDVASLLSFLHDAGVLIVAGLLGLVFAVRVAAFLVPFLVHLADGSHYCLDPAHPRLIYRTGVLGVGLWERAWTADAVAGVDLESAGPDDPVELSMRQADGTRVFLADDCCPYPDRYHRSDLARIGRRLAAGLGVPFTVSLPPELPVK